MGGRSAHAELDLRRHCAAMHCHLTQPAQAAAAAAELALPPSLAWLLHRVDNLP